METEFDKTIDEIADEIKVVEEKQIKAELKKEKYKELNG